MGRLAGKVALVSGGARGLGLAMAEAMVAEGAAVAIGDLRTAEASAAAAALGDAAMAVSLDVTDEAATEERLRTLADELGLKPGQLFMQVRVAVTGRTQSPGLFETLKVIGQERVNARIAAANEKLTASLASA